MSVAITGVYVYFIYFNGNHKLKTHFSKQQDEINFAKQIKSQVNQYSQTKQVQNGSKKAKYDFFRGSVNLLFIIIYLLLLLLFIFIIDTFGSFWSFHQVVGYPLKWWKITINTLKKYNSQYTLK